MAYSEIYTTWEPAAIRASIIAIVSFAHNRIFTVFYLSRGYDFDITADTAYDQKLNPELECVCPHLIPPAG